MGGHAKQNQTPPVPTDERQTTGHDRRAVRTVDLTEEDIAAIEASEMTPGFEHLDAELEPEPASLLEEGARFARELRARGDRTEARPADKVFRDGLYEEP